MRTDADSGAEQALRKECKGQGEAGHRYVRGMQAHRQEVREQSKGGVFKNHRKEGEHKFTA